MESTDPEALERRFRRTYELARLKNALRAFIPMLLVVAASAAFGHRPAVVLVVGPLLFAAGVLALWYGGEPGRGVFPGALAGGAALVLVLCANQMGHLCTGERCLSWCLPACITGGLLAGSLVSVVGVRQKRGWGYWLSASSITLLTGALGCSCVGFSGLLGLAGGFVAVTLFAAAAAAAARRQK